MHVKKLTIIVACNSNDVIIGMLNVYSSRVFTIFLQHNVEDNCI